MIQSKIKKTISQKQLKSNFAMFSLKRILITGAAGSIGSELSVQIAKLKPDVLVLVDFGETELFYLELRMKEQFPSLNLKVKIADIKDQTAVDGLMREYRPEIVFHAAAYKHIPLMESNPRQAVLNNIMGTKVLAKTAKKYKAKKFVMISTDKAADPIGVMGASKKIAESYISNMNTGATIYIIVRFGNVLGSRGSVVPIIEDQIKNGLPITLTDPGMKRFFMTIPEAVFLVLQGAKIGRNRDIFILDMGRKIKIVELANKIIRAFGKTPGKDIDITFTGKRPGEKIEEQLVSKSENVRKTQVKRLLKISSKAKKISLRKIDQLIEYAQVNYNDKKIRDKIFGLIASE